MEDRNIRREHTLSAILCDSALPSAHPGLKSSSWIPRNPIDRTPSILQFYSTNFFLSPLLRRQDLPCAYWDDLWYKLWGWQVYLSEHHSCHHW